MQPLLVVLAFESLLASLLEVPVFASVLVALAFLLLLGKPASASLRAGETRNRLFEVIANIQGVYDDITGRIY